jgi:hypothetical protein
MFIVLGPLHRASPFGGAETEFKIIIQGRFRSSERRRRELACWGYKHGTAQVSRLTVVVS